MTSIFIHLKSRRRAATILLLVIAIALMASTAHTSKSKRLPKSWRKHIRRMKQAARKAGVAYKTSQPTGSIPLPPKKA